MDSDEIRRQVVRRLRYGLNVVALERDLVPPEGPYDVALTNGLAAIVAQEQPGAERDSKDRMLSARALLKVASDAGIDLDFEALTDALDVTQPMRHARADDEFLAPVARHLAALQDLDRHPALLVLDHARSTARVDALIDTLYRESAEDVSGISMLSPKDRLDQPELEECDECWRKTFLPSGIDEFGGTNTAGRCIACGYERDADAARELAIGAELTRLVAKDN